MHHARRLIAILTGCATWCVAAATVAYAQVVPDPGGGPLVAPPPPADTGTPIWEFVLTAALGVLLALAVVGLVFSLRHSRTAQTSRRSEPTSGSRA